MTTPKPLFVTGTDTNVGKTHVSCLIARQCLAQGRAVAIYKPACSGAIEKAAGDTIPKWDDIERIKSVIGTAWPDEVICPQRFLAPLAPPVAAKREGRAVDYNLLVRGADAFETVDLLLIEGAGGWLAPITDDRAVADLASGLQAPILIVARAGLGTINHTLLTIESVRARGLRIAGVVLNEVSQQTDESSQTNAEQIEAFSGVPVFGTVPYGDPLQIKKRGIAVTLDWEQIAAK